jgi:hypothetical protein
MKKDFRPHAVGVEIILDSTYALSEKHTKRLAKIVFVVMMAS